MPADKCAHCGIYRYIAGRGLCKKCHTNIRIRFQFECEASDCDDPGERMTEEELDAMIEEQRKCLPDWWHEDDGDDGDDR